MKAKLYEYSIDKIGVLSIIHSDENQFNIIHLYDLLILIENEAMHIFELYFFFIDTNLIKTIKFSSITICSLYAYIQRKFFCGYESHARMLLRTHIEPIFKRENHYCYCSHSGNVSPPNMFDTIQLLQMQRKKINALNLI